VDIPQVFPDFSADPEDPESYVFGPTDTYLQAILNTGARIVYRLGVSIEHAPVKYHTHPPADFEKWARVCLGVIRHYTQGWAKGMHQAVDYWEIWNEPDIGVNMWSGTFEEYMKLYEVTARAIKAVDPSLKVGGYAAASVIRDNVPQFLQYCRERELPLDFFSWHTYAASPEQLAMNARTVRRLLDEHGFTATESHLNEWNYWAFDWETIFLPGYEYVRRDAFERQKNEEGASFVAASLICLQDASVDVANYYDGQPITLFCGLFDYYGCPQKAYYAFKAFRRMLDYPQRVKSTAVEEDSKLHSLAAVDAKRKRAALLIANFGGNVGECELQMRALPIEPGAVCRVYMLDRDHNLDLVSTQTLDAADAAIRVLLRRHSAALVTVG
jgi:beta-xylosidase